MRLRLIGPICCIAGAISGQSGCRRTRLVIRASGSPENERVGRSLHSPRTANSQHYLLLPRRPGFSSHQSAGASKSSREPPARVIHHLFAKPRTLWLRPRHPHPPADFTSNNVRPRNVCNARGRGRTAFRAVTSATRARTEKPPVLPPVQPSKGPLRQERPMWAVFARRQAMRLSPTRGAHPSAPEDDHGRCRIPHLQPGADARLLERGLGRPRTITPRRSGQEWGILYRPLCILTFKDVRPRYTPKDH